MDEVTMSMKMFDKLMLIVQGIYCKHCGIQTYCDNRDRPVGGGECKRVWLDAIKEDNEIQGISKSKTLEKSDLESGVV